MTTSLRRPVAANYPYPPLLRSTTHPEGERLRQEWDAAVKVHLRVVEQHRVHADWLCPLLGGQACLVDCVCFEWGGPYIHGYSTSGDGYSIKRAEPHCGNAMFFEHTVSRD